MLQAEKELCAGDREEIPSVFSPRIGLGRNPSCSVAPEVNISMEVLQS